MLRIDSGEESNSDSASFYSIDAQISDKSSSKLSKFDSFKSIYSVDPKNDSSQHLEHIRLKDSAKLGFEKSCEQLDESSESCLNKNLNVKNSVNVIIMSSSGATPKSELSKADLKDSGKKKKGIRLSFKRKKSSKKEKSGVSGTDSDFSSSNPITPQSTPQVTPHGTLEKNATPWKNDESSRIDNVGQEIQVSEKIKSEKKFGPILMFKREPKKLKAITPPVVPLPHESATAHEPVQKYSDDENYKTLTMGSSTSDAVEQESVTDRVNISRKFPLITNLSDTEEELGPIDDVPPKFSKISAYVEEVSPTAVISKKGMDIAEGRFNPEKYREVEENVFKDTVLRKNVLISELTTDEFFIDDAETDSKIEALVNEVKSIAQEIVEVELIEKSNLTPSPISNEESLADKVTVRKKISNEIPNESGNLSISRPIYQSLAETIPYTNEKIGRSSVNSTLNNSYPSFSSKIFISIEEPKSEDPTLEGEPVSRDSLVKNIDQLTNCPRPLPFKRYAPFGTVFRSKHLTSMSFSRSFSIDTEDEGFFIPRKSPTSYSNTNICAEIYNTERSANVETSGQLSDSWAVSSSDKKEHLYKILVIGELGTGKTSIIKRYVHQFFCQHYRATIGVDFALKVLNWDENTVIRLQLWDIAGQERFGNMTRVYYKQAVGAFVVFDVSNAKTFDAVTKWKNDLDSKVTLPDGSNIPTVLLANKCDQPKEGLVSSPSKMDEYCREKNFAGWFETSAKEDVNIDEATKFLITKILNNEEEGLMIDESFDKEKFSIEGNHEEEAERKKCIC